MSELVVAVESVGKKFCRGLKRGMTYTASDVSRDLIGLSTRSETLRDGEFWAVDGVSFEMRRGDCFGLIGSNGAGKSTLLKMLNGIIRPDRGEIRIAGRVGALIEVGAGFHPMLTGRENVYVNGAILGMTRREIDRKFDQIVEFSGLSFDVLNAPVKSYSSGMYVRLGFAVAVHTEPDVLLVDEVLSVGDIRFIGQCRKKIAELRARGTSMILVSHSLSLIEETCERGILLIGGKVAAEGTAKSVTAAYRRNVSEAGSRAAMSADASDALRFISGTLRDMDGRPTDRLTVGDTGTLDILVQTVGEINSGHFCVWILRESDDQIVGVGYLNVGRDLAPFRSGNVRLTFDCRMMPGDYQLGATYSTDGKYGLVDQFEPCGFEVVPRPDHPFEPSGVFELTVRGV